MGASRPVDERAYGVTFVLTHAPETDQSRSALKNLDPRDRTADIGNNTAGSSSRERTGRFSFFRCLLSVKPLQEAVQKRCRADSPSHFQGHGKLPIILQLMPAWNGSAITDSVAIGTRLDRVA